MDEVGSQLDGLDLGSGGGTCHVSNGNDGHVSHGSGGRQLVPGLLYIDDKKPSSQHKVSCNGSSFLLDVRIMCSVHSFILVKTLLKLNEYNLLHK